MPYKSSEITPISLTKIREGGRTVGSGREATIIEQFIESCNSDNVGAIFYRLLVGTIRNVGRGGCYALCFIVGNGE